MSFFPIAEGYFNAETQNYVYQHLDHLGNVRVSYSDANKNNKIDVGEIVEENNYYPFGLAHKGYNEKNNTIAKNYKYQYNGKENQEELGFNVYDYGARNYDVAIGRWMNVDPLAEQFPAWNPYHYVHNNPINLIDPTGMKGEDWYLNNTSGDLEWINGNKEVEGYTHLGEDLTFHFSSFIDRTSWNQDKGTPWAPFDVSGEKLYSSVIFDFSQDEKGNLIGLNSIKSSSKIMTNDGGFTGVEYNRDGFINDTFSSFSKNSGTQPKQWVTFSLEKHAKVPIFEALGIMVQGGNVVNVAQKLDIVGFGNKMRYSSYTDIFPSARLSINNVEVMKYMQPSFSKTHTIFGRPEHRFYERKGVFNYGQPR